MSTQDEATSELRVQQKKTWAEEMCAAALGIEDMWQAIADDLGISVQGVQILTNLAKKSGDNTLSESELAGFSGVTAEGAKAAIDTLLERGWAVRRLPKAGDAPQDRRIQLRKDFVPDIFEYYALQAHHFDILDEFDVAEMEVARRVLRKMASIGHDQAAAIKQGRIIAGARLKATLNSAG